MKKFPKQGFYVWNVYKWAKHKKLTQEKLDRVLATPSKINVIYSSGTTKGNYYYDPQNHSDKWNFLMWTCVPSIKELEACYDYHEINPTDKEFLMNKINEILI